MRFNSSLVTAVAGRLGNYVGMMNRAGMCLRTWVRPSNPKTGAQTGVRNTFKTYAGLWTSTLTDAQRAAWNAYAATLTYTSKLGTDYQISGFDAYVAANTARVQCGLAAVSDGPTVGGFAGGTAPTITFDVTAQKVKVAFTNTDEWAGEVGGALSVRLCPLGFDAGINYYEGPFKFLDSIDGAGSPPSSPAQFTPPFTLVEGVQYAVAVRFLRADGRYSLPTIFRGLGVVP